MHASVAYLKPLPKHFDRHSDDFIPGLQEGDFIRMDVRVVSRDGKQDAPHTLAMLEATLDGLKAKFPHVDTCAALQTDGCVSVASLLPPCA